MNRTVRFYTLAAFLLLAGFGAGWLARSAVTTSSAAAPIREPQGKYRFINPLIGFNVGEKEEFGEYAELKRRLEAGIGALMRQKKVHSASVYFRDMESGHWTGVNEEELYSPASLYKVALMMAVLKKAEDESGFMDEPLRFKGSRYAVKPDHEPLKAGTAYTVRELLTRVITLSDNDAKDVLRDRIGQEAVSRVFADLRLAEPELRETGDSMSARTYSRFFRALYNATYLNRTSSEYALLLLSRVDWRSGIVNGLPPEGRTLTVAHKFGYRVFEDPTDSVTEEVHDCGIVYLPERPYFICIMTKGFVQTDLLDTIQALSRAVYEEVARATP